MASNTQYLVDIEYRLSDKAGKALDDLGNKADRTNSKLSGLKDTFLALGGAFLISKAFNEGTKAFITFNSTMEQSKIGVATVVAATFNRPFDEAMGRAKGVQQELLNFSKEAPGALADYTMGFTILGANLKNTNISLKEMTALTENVVAASQISGLGGDALVAELGRSFTGAAVRHVGPLVTFLSMAGIEFEKFRTMTGQQRLEAVTKGLQSSAFKGALAEQGKTFDAQLQSFKDNLSIMLGAAGLPIFKAVTSELKDWNAWIEKNPGKIQAFATKFGQALHDGFGYVKDAVGWVVDNKDTLLSIAEAYAAITIGSGVGGTLTNIATGIGGLGTATKYAEGTLMAFGTSATSLITPMALLAAGAIYAAEKLDEIHKTDVEGTYADQALIMDRMNHPKFGPGGMTQQRAGEWVETAKQMGAYKDGQFDPQALHMGLMHDKIWGDRNHNQREIEQTIAIAASVFEKQHQFSMIDGIPQPGPMDPQADLRTKPIAQNITANIKVEVASDDPDRFSEGLTTALSQWAKAPTQSGEAFRGMQ